MDGSKTAGREERGREIRIALVLYGGVSLAVYENGVSRAFFDLVRENGPFRLLLKILDANAVVDVVSGTSAGGINGLFLAAALESGGDFTKTSDLWRKHGDLGALLRPVAASENAESLLDGEGYFQKRLEEAFLSILTPTSEHESTPGEMDVFITGTNLEGILTTSWDSLGARIDDKTHRTVFRLQHRPGRKALGYADSGSKGSLRLQACILASIARITSTFPVAFPPFSLEQIPRDLREKVKEALERTSRTRPTHHVYVDGGVLDNKPFGPALEAIFYRMPHKPVDRRLFYVEPDPEHLTPLTDDESKRLRNPFRVAAASLNTIPSHESIGEDLEKLKAHNARIRWLQRIKKDYPARFRSHETATSASPDCCAPDGEIYRRVRVDSLCTLMVSDTDDVPSAKTEIADPERVRLFDSLRQKLLALIPVKGTTSEVTGSVTDWLHPYDVEWHMRCAFHVLYELYTCVDDPKQSTHEDLLGAVRATGRIIKTLKVIRNGLALTRDNLFQQTNGGKHLEPELLLKSLTTYLEPENEVWGTLTQKLAAETGASKGASFLRKLQDRADGPLGSSVLTETSLQAWQWSSDVGVDRLGPRTLSAAPQRTILTILHDALKEVVQFTADRGNLIEDFVLLDRAFYPLEFAAGIHELDEIQYVRISPRDAQTGLSAVAPGLKVTGDDLAHFAAFFRRDWRSNDILWGRIDGICQIVRGLLEPKVQKRLWHRRWSLPDGITMESLDDHFSGCPLSQKKALLRSWRDLMDTRPPASCSDDDPQGVEWFQKLGAFRDRFITAAQYHAVSQDLGTLYEDVYFQEIVWGTVADDVGVGPQSGEAIIAARARERGIAARSSVKDCGLDFQEMALGSQTVAGPKGAVPAHILTEYTCQVYLLVWCLMQTALKGHKRLSGFFSRRMLRWTLRIPIAFVYHLVRTQRLQPRSFPILGVSSVAALLACGATGLFLGNLWFMLPIAAALAVMAIATWLKRTRQ